MKFKWDHKMHYAWMVMIAGIFLQAGCLGIQFNAASAFFRPVAASIGTEMGNLTLYITITQLVSAAAMPLVGKWLPTKNINVLLTVMAVICGVGYMLMSTYTQVWQWYISAAIMGFSSAFLWFVPVPMMLRNWFKKKTGLAIGIATAFSGVAAAIAQPAEAIMIKNIGWSQAYIIMGIISLALTLPFTLFVFKFKPSDVGMKAYGESEGDTVAQAKADMSQGMSFKRAAKSGVLILIILFTGFIALMACFSQYMTPFGNSIFGNETEAAVAMAGLVTSCSMIGNILGKLVLGGVNDKAGVKVAFILCVTLVIAALILLLTASGIAPVLYTAAVMYGFAMSATTVLVPLLVNPMVGGKNFPMIFSYAQMGNMVIGSLGIAVCGQLFNATKAYTIPLIFVLICTIVCVPLVFFALAKAKKVGFDNTENAVK